MTPLLFIVASGERRLYADVARSFTDTGDVQVLVDRRVAERRRSAAPAPGGERRGGDRRRRREADEDLRALGWTLVPGI